MRRNKIFILTILVTIRFFDLMAQEVHQQLNHDNKYFGQIAPGEKQEKFAPCHISLPERYEYGSVFSQDISFAPLSVMMGSTFSSPARRISIG